MQQQRRVPGVQRRQCGNCARRAQHLPRRTGAPLPAPSSALLDIAQHVAGLLPLGCISMLISAVRRTGLQAGCGDQRRHLRGLQSQGICVLLPHPAKAGSLQLTGEQGDLRVSPSLTRAHDLRVRRSGRYSTAAAPSTTTALSPSLSLPLTAMTAASRIPARTW